MHSLTWSLQPLIYSCEENSDNISVPVYVSDFVSVQHVQLRESRVVSYLLFELHSMM